MSRKCSVLERLKSNSGDALQFGLGRDRVGFLIRRLAARTHYAARLFAQFGA